MRNSVTIREKLSRLFDFDNKSHKLMSYWNENKGYDLKIYQKSLDEWFRSLKWHGSKAKSLLCVFTVLVKIEEQSKQFPCDARCSIILLQWVQSCSKC